MFRFATIVDNMITAKNHKNMPLLTSCNSSNPLAEISTDRLENSAMHFSVAPMLDWTDKHCRYFYRTMTQNSWLYSEMVTTGAIIYGDNLPRFLGFNPTEDPVVLQLGGSNAQELAHCAKLGQEWGYSEINLNVGCPSDRVQNNMIGACLMLHPQILAEAVDAMKQSVDIPVTVKCRIGVDDQNEQEELFTLVDKLNQVGVDGLVIHARKAWLQGLSPKDNRDVPPLNYDLVHAVKHEFATLPIAINGGIKSHTQAISHLESIPAGNFDTPVDGVMLGRIIYEQPFLLNEVDERYYGCDKSTKTRKEVVNEMLPYIEQHLDNGGKLIQITRHMLGLFHGLPGGRMWRRYLSQNAFKPEASTQTVVDALCMVEDEIQRMAEQKRQFENDKLVSNES